MTDSDGNVVWRGRYSTWGKLVCEHTTNHTPDGFTQPLRMQGQYDDGDTGLYYNTFRFYDTDAGMFTTEDPIGLSGGDNLYQYAPNPMAWADPLGLKTFTCKKPLKALGGDGERRGPDIWGNPLYHQYLCISDGKGCYTCGGQDLRGQKWYDPLNSPGKPSSDEYDPQTCQQIEPDDVCIEECLLKKFAGPRPRYGIPFGTDCQEWSSNALKDCKKK